MSHSSQTSLNPNGVHQPVPSHFVHPGAPPNPYQTPMPYGQPHWQGTVRELSLFLKLPSIQIFSLITHLLSLSVKQETHTDKWHPQIRTQIQRRPPHSLPTNRRTAVYRRHRPATIRHKAT